MPILLHWGTTYRLRETLCAVSRAYSLAHAHTHTLALARCVVVPIGGGGVLIKPNPRRASSLCSPTPAARLSQECRNLLSHNSSNQPPHSALRGTGDKVTQISVKKKGKTFLLPPISGKKKKKKNKVLKNNGGGERKRFFFFSYGLKHTQQCFQLCLGFLFFFPARRGG